jgi:hypothetical protein
MSSQLDMEGGKRVRMFVLAIAQSRDTLYYRVPKGALGQQFRPAAGHVVADLVQQSWRQMEHDDFNTLSPSTPVRLVRRIKRSTPAPAVGSTVCGQMNAQLCFGVRVLQ